ncbi:glycoside hydrolase family 43 protein [Paenibacillus arenilitoris]|uniref:Glycoside hydrolase 43 family protein n=1 Tax=Paenibacillus arenilitoris TaxID=2772299 RepID=A0A927CJY4_9BACL|nr:glycoside hydrolase 43 family protein [Paenibacillus arenilitoris]MBD2867070.1 glycoside hydrolase 43 family protein [Paenibacillus arenilitoris]
MNKTLITNPIIWADVPDVDPIRVENSYYMVSTSMHMMPGCPIMKSGDLMNWEIVGYVYDFLENNDAHNLTDGKNIYGQGSWAASLRHHNDTFYVCFSSNDTRRFYVYRTKDIERGPWERSVIDGLRHDPGLLFDEGRVFVFSGNGGIRITELTADAAAVKPGGIDRLLFETERDGIGLRCEGCHAYRLNGYYYLLFIEWPSAGSKRRRQICYRSRELLGPYERRIVLDDDLGYRNKGVAQGGIFDTPTGEWYAMLFQDHDAVGRIPCLVPVAWEDDWPVFGIDGKVPERFEVDLPKAPAKPLVISDEFDYGSNRLALNWQWNHNPDNRLWSVTERPGFLRLRTGSLTDSVVRARNTLTQRTEGPSCTGETVLDTARMKPGDHAGLVALQSHFGTVGVKMADDGGKFVAMCVSGGNGEEIERESVRFDGGILYLKIRFEFEDSVDLATFYYSADGSEWTAIGEALRMKYTLDHFMGYRIGLFNYAAGQSGGYADFDYFRYERS